MRSDRHTDHHMTRLEQGDRGFAGLQAEGGHGVVGDHGDQPGAARQRERDLAVDGAGVDRADRAGQRSDDDETFYEAPVHVETVTAWRLPDHRWLTSHQVIGDVEYAAPVPRLSLCTGMPR